MAIGRGLARAVAAGSALMLSGCASAPAPNAAVTIRWDQWGVAHISGRSDEALAYGLGWAQARGRPDLVLRLMGQARGRASEYWGEEHRQSDELMWRLGLPQSLPALYAAQAPEQRRQLDAFAQGINDYAAAHPDRIDDALERALPVTPLDVLGHTQRVIHLTFVMGGELGRLNGEIERGEARTPGSNAWAVAPSRSEGGAAMLLTNPHLPWDDLFYFFEAHLIGEDIDAYGVTLIAFPYLVLAFNEHSGWTHTVNTYDGADTFRFARSGDGYLVDGAVRPFEAESVQLSMRRTDGSIEARPIEFKRTIAGPVVRETADAVYVLRVAGLADPARSRIMEQYWRMARARDADEFEAAMAMLQMPMFNTVYADDSGDIFYLFNALAPRRASGDARMWAGTVDGGDSSVVWGDYLAYADLPRFRSPPSGFIQNANEPPWTSTTPSALDPSDFPDDFEPPSLSTRAQNSLSLLLADERISFEEMIAYSHSTRLVSADNVLDDLLVSAARSNDPLVREARDVLAAWDRQSRAESRGAVLYAAWARRFGLDGGDYERPWRFETPSVWPRGLVDDNAAVAALRVAAADVSTRHGRLDVAWGEAAPVRWRGQAVPVDLGSGGLGAFRVGFFAGDPAGDIQFLGGTTYVAATEFADEVKARAILPYGNFENPPPGVVDQVALLARNELRPVNFRAADVEAATIELERLTMR